MDKVMCILARLEYETRDKIGVLRRTAILRPIHWSEKYDATIRRKREVSCHDAERGHYKCQTEEPDWGG